MISAVVAGLAGLVWLTLLVRPGLVAARILQIEEYEVGRLLRWSWRPGRRWRRATILAGALCLAGGGADLMGGIPGWSWSAAAWALAAAGLHLWWREQPAKKPLVFTSRMRRLLAVAGLVSMALTTAIVAVLLLAPAPLGALAAAAACAIAPMLAAAVLAVAVALSAPVELLVVRHYRRRAESTIRAVRPTVIAVAGSYGKTSTKHILASLLTPHTPVLATPRSYNNLMGVTRTINELLQTRHRAFVVEMDAYGPGEIARMCRLCPPRISVVTAVGPQHLERFRSPEAIQDALLETVEALAADGTAIVYAGDEPSRALVARAASMRQTVTYAFAEEWPDADVLVSGLSMGGDGCRFAWRSRRSSATYQLRCRLLGRHNALNVAAALAAVECLGLPLEPSVRAVSDLEPTEHRLQPLPGGAGVTVIDDSYNANPVGVRNALETLQAMDASQRILVTPGLVELGPREAEENRAFGRHAAAVCDHVVVVGSHNRLDLEAGLREGGMAAERVRAVESLEQATEALGALVRPMTVVLFCNDLPDPYLDAAAPSRARS